MFLALLKLFQIVKDLVAVGLTSIWRGEEGIDNDWRCQQCLSPFFSVELSFHWQLQNACKQHLVLLTYQSLARLFNLRFTGGGGLYRQPIWLSTVFVTLKQDDKDSGDDRARTDNLRLARAALSQLSYVPMGSKPTSSRFDIGCGRTRTSDPGFIRAVL